MDNEKEKVNWKFVFAVTIPVSIVASIVITLVVVIILSNSSISSEVVSTEEVQANNERFTSSFGQNVSSSEVKNLINLIRLNNITAQSDRDGLGVIYIILNGTQIEPTQVSKKIQNGKRYSIYTPNNNSISENTFINKKNEYKANDKELSSAYYYNYYIRVINIDEVNSEITDN